MAAEGLTPAGGQRLAPDGGAQDVEQPVGGLLDRVQTARLGRSEPRRGQPTSCLPRPSLPAQAALGGKAQPTAADVKAILSAVGAEADEERLAKLLSELEGKNIDEVVAAGVSKLASVPSGGAVAAAPAGETAARRGGAGRGAGRGWWAAARRWLVVVMHVFAAERHSCAAEDGLLKRAVQRSH